MRHRGHAVRHRGSCSKTQGVMESGTGGHGVRHRGSWSQTQGSWSQTQGVMESDTGGPVQKQEKSQHALY